MHCITIDADLRANSQAEDEEAVVAEIAELMTKMERTYEHKSLAEQQVRAVAKRSASRRESNENVRARSYRQHVL